jgi:hypothetical protein
VVFATVLLASSASANAMLCELDEGTPDETMPNESAWSSQLAASAADVSVASPAALAAPVVFKEKPPKRRCDSYDSIDCDLNRPEGAPQTPRPIVPRRPLAALAPSDAPMAPLVGRRLAPTFETGHERPGYVSELFRPPRRSPRSSTSH